MPTARKSATLWTLAMVVTLASATYQRCTGPTYPIRGQVTLNGKRLPYKLVRSHSGETNCPIQIETRDPAIQGQVEWKRHRVKEAWAQVPMTYADGQLTVALPHQPLGAKLDYRVVLSSGTEVLTLPKGAPADIRFKGDVPDYILIPHVLAMFTAMLLSTRTGLEVFGPSPRLKLLTYGTLGTLLAGGAILGPIVQKHAFGAYWNGLPFGSDLTDNKTLVALLGWVLAAAAIRKARRPEIWAAVAAAVLLAVYMIPHSLLGTEYDYSKSGNEEIVQPAP